MGRWKSPLYPGLLVIGAVKFVDGVADVDDEHDARLTKLSKLGVVPDNAQPAPVGAGSGNPADGEAPADAEGTEPGGEDGPQVPAGNASRAEWATFVAELGVTVDDTMKRDDLRALAEQLLADDDEESDDDEDAEGDASAASTSE